MNKEQQKCRTWFKNTYSSQGLTSQRRYPNEELVRFLARLKPAAEKQSRLRVLEVGCGSCANLWAIAREGFDAHGLDVSLEGLVLGQHVLTDWGVCAAIVAGTMTELPYQEKKFDAVVDVLAAYSLTQDDFTLFLKAVAGVLKPGGQFFSYTLSVNSSAFQNYHPSKKIDAFTLDGIHRKDSPYYGNQYPVRFVEPQGYQAMLEEEGFVVSYLELSSRTYAGGDEVTEYITVVAEKS